MQQKLWVIERFSDRLPKNSYRSADQYGLILSILLTDSEKRAEHLRDAISALKEYERGEKPFDPTKHATLTKNFVDAVKECVKKLGKEKTDIKQAELIELLTNFKEYCKSPKSLKDLGLY